MLADRGRLQRIAEARRSGSRIAGSPCLVNHLRPRTGALELRRMWVPENELSGPALAVNILVEGSAVSQSRAGRRLPL